MPRPYTREEDDFIRANWPRLNSVEIGRQLGRGRVYNHIRNKMRLPSKKEHLTIREIFQASPPKPTLLDEEPFIKPPTLAQLMGRR